MMASSINNYQLGDLDTLIESMKKDVYVLSSTPAKGTDIYYTLNLPKEEVCQKNYLVPIGSLLSFRHEPYTIMWDRLYICTSATDILDELKPAKKYKELADEQLAYYILTSDTSKIEGYYEYIITEKSHLLPLYGRGMMVGTW
jgi:hypothetical protein